MANLQGLQDFATSQGFNLTNPLDHDQVVRLAEHWLPDIRFYEKEKFHPISLDEVVSMVEDLFAQLPDSDRDEWRVSRFVRTGLNTRQLRKFDPPVVHVPDIPVLQENSARSTVRVLNDGNPTLDAFEHPEVDADAVITHGASFRRANKFFGGTELMFSDEKLGPGNPFRPRATGEGGLPRISVIASFKNLLETLKYELAVEETENYPPDGLRGGFDIASLLIKHADPNTPVVLFDRGRILLEVIAAHEAGEPIATAVEGLPEGYQLDELAWEAVTRYAFLEYDLFYAYNDFERVQTTPFDNEHEGDDEGFCLVFDRNVINLAAASDAPDSLFRAVPHSIITAVHEEYQDADVFKFIPPPIPSPDDPDRLPREDVDLTVYVAWGSHATYLTPGDHDLVDFQDTFGFVNEKLPIPLIGPAIALPLAIIIAIIDHFVDTEDKTSDDGVRTGPENIVGDHPTAVTNRLLVMPMSADEHIYEAEHEDLLRLRAFAGKWGGHDGIFDKSPSFKAKTGRYFRKLLAKL